MARGSVAVASVAVAFAASLGTFLVALIHASGASPAAVSAAGGLAVGASAVTGAVSVRCQPPILAMWEETRWAFSAGAVMLQIAGASAWLVAGGPWPPALAALSVGAGLLATIPRAPKQRRVVDLREVPSTDLSDRNPRQIKRQTSSGMSDRMPRGHDLVPVASSRGAVSRPAPPTADRRQYRQRHPALRQHWCAPSPHRAAWL